ncbi:MAG: response regulator [Geminicoccaceae bacterium]
MAPALNVLLAEDNPVNQEVAIGLLETLDCAVTVVENGEEAVDAATGGGFDLVLMDCQMPIMDGLDATRAIRKASSAGAERLPIVALTAEVLNDVKSACLDAGMDDLLGKPFSRQEMEAMLLRWRSDPDFAKPAEPEIAAAPQASSIDLAPIETLRALDPENERGLVGRAIAKFVDYSDELMVRFADVVSRADVAEVSRIAHSLKSSSANLGASAVSRQCAEIEKLTACGQLPDDMTTRLHDLQAAVRTARQDLLALAGSE